MPRAGGASPEADASPSVRLSWNGSAWPASSTPGVGQTLAAIRLQVEVISTELPDAPPRVGQALDSITALAGGALEQVRAVSQRLHPPEWQRLTLASALRQLWEISGIPDRFEGELRIDPLPSEPVPEVKALLYRSMQEALSNLVRHSHATRVNAILRAVGNRVVLDDPG